MSRAADITHREHVAKRPHQTGLSELTAHLLTFTTPVVAAAANRQAHVQALGRPRALDDVLIPQLSVADQCHSGHTWPKQQSGGSSCEEVVLLWTLHVVQTHSRRGRVALLRLSAVDISVRLRGTSNIRVKGRRKSRYAAPSSVTSKSRHSEDIETLPTGPSFGIHALLSLLLLLPPTVVGFVARSQNPFLSSRFASVTSAAAAVGATHPTLVAFGRTLPFEHFLLFCSSLPSTHPPSALPMLGPPPAGVCCVWLAGQLASWLWQRGVRALV